MSIPAQYPFSSVDTAPSVKEASPTRSTPSSGTIDKLNREILDLVSKMGRDVPYQRIISIDDPTGPGVSINSGDSIPDLDHQELGARLVEALINKGKERNDPAFKTVERLALVPQEQNKSDPSGLVAVADKILSSAPNKSGQSDLRDVAVYIPYYLPDLTSAERAAMEKLIAAKADVYVSEGNFTQGGNTLLRIPGVIGVGGSDGPIGAPINRSEQSQINPWAGMDDGINNKFIDVTVNSRLKFVPIMQDEKLKGWDATGDGKVDFEAGLKKSSAALASQFAGKDVSGIKVGPAELAKLNNEITKSFNDIAEKYKSDPEKAYQLSLEMRKAFVAKNNLANKLVSVQDLKALQGNYLTGRYQIEQHAPDGINPNNVYVSLGTVAAGDLYERYRDDVVFFNADQKGKLQALTDNLTANGPSANSWAVPNGVAGASLGHLQPSSDILKKWQFER